MPEPQKQKINENDSQDQNKKEEGDENGEKRDKMSSEEKRRRQVYKEEQELRAFEERGGFAGVLRDIFRPQAADGVDLDSVHQLSSLCTGFYHKKYSLDKRLVQALDALTNERPNTMSFKKKHTDVRCSTRFQEEVEWVRLNAEKERIQKYKSIAQQNAITYYKIMQKFVEETQEIKR